MNFIPPTDPEVVVLGDDIERKWFWAWTKLGIIAALAWMVLSVVNVILCGIS